MFDRSQRNLDGWNLNHDEKVYFIKKITKFGDHRRYCPRCGKRTSRFYCVDCVPDFYMENASITDFIRKEVEIEIKT